MLIDVTRLLGRFMKGRIPTGVDRVSLAYVRHYGKQARALVRWAGQAFILSDDASKSVFQRLLTPFSCRGADIGSLLMKGVLSGRSERIEPGRLLFNTGHSGLEKGSYPEIIKRWRVRPIFLVHDLIPITHHEYCRSGELDRHVIRMNTVLDYAAGIITNSRSTLDSLEAYARTTGKAMPQAVSALLAAEIDHIACGPRLIADPYFVMLGTIEPRKNHWMLLHIWKSLVEQHGKSVPRLVIIGQRGWECENVVDMLERCEQLREHVIELNECSDGDLVTWIHHARALLFPSFAEGYGLPMAESLSLGVPVIASCLPVFREIAGDIPEYIDPLDGRRWQNVILDYAEPESLSRAAQISRMKAFATPRWQEHFALVDQFLERLHD